MQCEYALYKSENIKTSKFNLILSARIVHDIFCILVWLMTFGYAGIVDLLGTSTFLLKKENDLFYFSLERIYVTAGMRDYT